MMFFKFRTFIYVLLIAAASVVESSTFQRSGKIDAGPFDDKFQNCFRRGDFAYAGTFTEVASAVKFNLVTKTLVSSVYARNDPGYFWGATANPSGTIGLFSAYDNRISGSANSTIVKFDLVTMQRVAALHTTEDYAKFMKAEAISDTHALFVGGGLQGRVTRVRFADPFEIDGNVAAPSGTERLSSLAVAPSKTHCYVTAMNNPGVVLKLQLSPTLEFVTSSGGFATGQSGDGRFFSIIYMSETILAVGTSAEPGRVVLFEATASGLNYLTSASGQSDEKRMGGCVAGLDAASVFCGTVRTPGIVVKYRYVGTTLSRDSAAAALSGEDLFFSAFLVNGTMWLGSGGTGAKLVSFDLGMTTTTTSMTSSTTFTSTTSGTTRTSSPTRPTSATTATTNAPATTTVATTSSGATAPAPPSPSMLSTTTTTTSSSSSSSSSSTIEETTTTTTTTTSGTFTTNLPPTSSASTTIPLRISTSSAAPTIRATTTSMSCVARATEAFPSTTTAATTIAETTQSPLPVINSSARNEFENYTAPGFDSATRSSLQQSAVLSASLAGVLGGSPLMPLTMSRSMAAFSLAGCPAASAEHRARWTRSPLPFPRSFLPGATAGAADGAHGRMAIVGFILGPLIAVPLCMAAWLAHRRRRIRQLRLISRWSEPWNLIVYLLQTAPVPYTLGKFYLLVLGFWSEASGMLAAVAHSTAAGVHGDGIFVDIVLMTAIPWSFVFAGVFLFMRNMDMWIFNPRQEAATTTTNNDGDAENGGSVPNDENNGNDDDDNGELEDEESKHTKTAKDEKKPEEEEEKKPEMERYGMVFCKIFVIPNPNEPRWLHSLKHAIADALRTPKGRFLVAGYYTWSSSGAATQEEIFLSSSAQLVQNINEKNKKEKNDAADTDGNNKKNLSAAETPASVETEKENPSTVENSSTASVAVTTAEDSATKNSNSESPPSQRRFFRGRLDERYHSLFQSFLGPPLPSDRKRCDQLREANRFRLRLAVQFSFPLLGLCGAVAAFAAGMAQADMDKSCSVSLTVILIVNIFAALYTLLMRPFAVPVRNVIAATTDCVIAVATIVAFASSRSGDGSSGVSSGTAVVQVLTSVIVTVAAVLEMILAATRNILFAILKLKLVSHKELRELKARYAAELAEEEKRYPRLEQPLLPDVEAGSMRPQEEELTAAGRGEGDIELSDDMVDRTGPRILFNDSDEDDDDDGLHALIQARKAAAAESLARKQQTAKEEEDHFGEVLNRGFVPVPTRSLELELTDAKRRVDKVAGQLEQRDQLLSRTPSSLSSFSFASLSRRSSRPVLLLEGSEFNPHTPQQSPQGEASSNSVAGAAAAAANSSALPTSLSFSFSTAPPASSGSLYVDQHMSTFRVRQEVALSSLLYNICNIYRHQPKGNDCSNSSRSGISSNERGRSARFDVNDFHDL